MKSVQQKWNDKNPERVRKSKLAWAERNREKIRDHARLYRKAHPYSTRARDLRNKYNITPAQYDAMFNAQNGRCAICDKTPQENGKRLTIDHCHKTGKVRGLLCYRCNTGLASFKDELRLVSEAVTYLAKAEGRS